MNYDVIIIGAGIYGLYSAVKIAKSNRDCKVLVVDGEKTALSRATYANQARLHMGYHYPRSIATAKKSAHYFNRFIEEYGFCVKKDFEQIYAISKSFSWTDFKQFERFCDRADIPYKYVNPDAFFMDNMISGAYKVQEYTYDAVILREYLDGRVKELANIDFEYGASVIDICGSSDMWKICLSNGSKFQTSKIFNTTYAATNLISNKAGMDTFSIKYELCEIILCETNDKLEDVGITVMDGPFFSIMPFGKSGIHSLTSVTFTPHETSYDECPAFSCQKKAGAACKNGNLGNCNECTSRPETAWNYMSALAHKYLRPEYDFRYRESLFAVKPILRQAEIDDSRPTVIKIQSQKPLFTSVLSGKINTVFDLDEVIANEFE